MIRVLTKRTLAELADGITLRDPSPLPRPKAGSILHQRDLGLYARAGVEGCSLLRGKGKVNTGTNHLAFRCVITPGLWKDRVALEKETL